MKFSLYAIASVILVDHALAFVPNSPVMANSRRQSSSRRHMAVDMPPPAATSSELPVVQQNAGGQPTDVRYSDFLRLVSADRVEKVTFSADGTQLLGVDVDGARVKIEALPNDPELLNSLTTHKVSCSKTNETILLVYLNNPMLTMFDTLLY
jgi:ATP-dependent Zn protease